MKAAEILSEIQNRWHNVYWFSRMLINNDKYIAVGKEPKLLSIIASSLRLVAKESKGNNTLSLQKQTLRNIIEERYKKTASRDNRVHRMLTELDGEINTLNDMEVFILTCENIMLPLHQYLFPHAAVAIPVSHPVDDHVIGDRGKPAQKTPRRR